MCPWCLGGGDDPEKHYDEAAEAGQIRLEDYASEERPIDEACDRCGRWLLAPFALKEVQRALEPPERCDLCHKETTACTCLQIGDTVLVDPKIIGGSMGEMVPNDKVGEGVTVVCDQVVPGVADYLGKPLSELRAWFKTKFMPALNNSGRRPCHLKHPHCSDVEGGWCSLAVHSALENEDALVSEAMNTKDDSPEGELRRAAQDHKGRP